LAQGYNHPILWFWW